MFYSVWMSASASAKVAGVFCRGKWYIVTPICGFVLNQAQLRPALHLRGATAGISIAQPELWVPQTELGS